MRLRRLEIQAFRGWWGRVSLDLDARLTVLVGENRAGKSSTTNAIEWCLFGADVEARKGGIAERADWEIHAREAPGLDTVVTLALENAGSTVSITRQRPPAGKRNQPDRFVVRLEGEPPREGSAAAHWLRLAGFPVWNEYRRAACFHQEAARQRVLDKPDRDWVLASLLGLKEEAHISEVTRGQARDSLVTQADAVLRNLEQRLSERLQRPRRELLDIERSLAERGVNRSDIRPGRAAAARRGLVEAAGRLARELGLPADAATFPDPQDAREVRDWAKAWPRSVRGASSRLDGLQALSERLGRLGACLAQVGPAQDALREARDRHRKSVEDEGDREERRRRLEDDRETLAAAKGARKRRDALDTLLKDARALVPAPGTSPCPVCRTPVEDLAARIDRFRAERGSDSGPEADAVIRRKERTVRLAEGGLDALSSLDRTRERAEAHYRKRLGELERLLRDAPPERREAHDPVADAKAWAEALRTQEIELQELEKRRNGELQTHIEASELLRELERWEEQSAAAERVVEIEALAANTPLQAAVDEAAGFAADVESLATLAREAQEERSRAREKEVNDSLAAYLALITGEPSEVRVQVHRTPKQITYRLRDGDRRPSVPVLNQAALNGLSLAMLFAQAEARARTRKPAFVVLDDPVQSLDAERQRGLARAIERLARACPVVVAVTPSICLDALRRTVGLKRRIYTLVRDPARGTVVEQSEEL